MPIAFINRSIENFKPASELAVVNAHHAHIRHERRRRAVKDAARKLNASILSYVDIDGLRPDDAPPMRDPLILVLQIGGLRSDPFWTLPVANSHNANASVRPPLQHHVSPHTPLGELDRRAV